MKNWKKRGAIVLAGLAAVGTAAALVLNALNSNIALYITPTEVMTGRRRRAAPSASAAWSRKAPSSATT